METWRVEHSFCSPHFHRPDVFLISRLIFIDLLDKERRDKHTSHTEPEEKHKHTSEKQRSAWIFQTERRDLALSRMVKTLRRGDDKILDRSARQELEAVDWYDAGRDRILRSWEFPIVSSDGGGSLPLCCLYYPCVSDVVGAGVEQRMYKADYRSARRSVGERCDKLFRDSDAKLRIPFSVSSYRCFLLQCPILSFFL